MRDTENRNSVKCKTDKIWKMTEVKTTKIRKNWKGKKIIKNNKKQSSNKTISYYILQNYWYNSIV